MQGLYSTYGWTNCCGGASIWASPHERFRDAGSGWGFGCESPCFKLEDPGVSVRDPHGSSSTKVARFVRSASSTVEGSSSNCRGRVGTLTPRRVESARVAPAMSSILEEKIIIGAP